VSGVSGWTSNGTTTITPGSGSILDFYAHNALLKSPYPAQVDANNSSDCLSTSTQSGCTAIGTTATGFSKHMTFGAATANTYDGVHQGTYLRWFYDFWTSGTPATATFNIQACPSANYSAGECSSGKTLLGSAVTGGQLTASSKSAQSTNYDVNLMATATPGTFAMLVGNPASNQSTIVVCGSTCTSGSWVLYLELTFAATTAGNYMDMVAILPLLNN